MPMPGLRSPWAGERSASASFLCTPPLTSFQQLCPGVFADNSIRCDSSVRLKCLDRFFRIFAEIAVNARAAHAVSQGFQDSLYRFYLRPFAAFSQFRQFNHDLLLSCLLLRFRILHKLRLSPMRPARRKGIVAHIHFGRAHFIDAARPVIPADMHHFSVLFDKHHARGCFGQTADFALFRAFMIVAVRRRVIAAHRAKCPRTVRSGSALPLCKFSVIIGAVVSAASIGPVQPIHPFPCDRLTVAAPYIHRAPLHQSLKMGIHFRRRFHVFPASSSVLPIQ